MRVGHGDSAKGRAQMRHVEHLPVVEGRRAGVVESARMAAAEAVRRSQLAALPSALNSMPSWVSWPSDSKH